MDRYQRVERPKEDTPINENEIRVTAQGRMRNYITYSTNLLQVQDLLAIPYVLFIRQARGLCQGRNLKDNGAKLL